MKQIKGRVIRILPTKEQEELIWKHINGCRFIWNRMLTHCIFRYQLSLLEKTPAKNKAALSGFDMNKLLTDFKTVNPWLNDIYLHSLQKTCSDLADAYKSFFKNKGFPKFKRKKTAKAAYPINDGVKFKEGYVQIPKLGKVKYQTNYELSEDAKISNPRIHLNPNGKWLLTFGVECDNQVLPSSGKLCGIDLGVKELAVIAIGNDIYTAANKNKTREVKQLRRKLKHLQREVSRKYRVGNKLNDKKWQKSNKIKKLEEQIKRIYFHLSNIQKNYIHQITSAIINQLPERVVMEDLNVKGMMKNRHLSKAIAEQNLYEFIRQMKYKCEWNSIPFVQADRYYPSSKTCHCCGYILKGLKLSDRTYVCPECGYTFDRDANAALNLRDYAAN